MAIVDVSGREVFYELYEPEATPAHRHPPLVLLNGISGSCRGWLPLQVPEFSKTRQTLVFDHRGVGRSQDPGGEFSTADLADDTTALLDALGIEQADILGGFMGGMAAQELALRHPDRVRRLILVGTYAKPDAKRRMLLEDWVALARARFPMEGMIRKRLVWTLSDETLDQADLMETMLDFFTKEDQPVGSELLERQCEACIRHDTSSRLSEIHQSTLVLCGREDQLTPPKFHRELAEGIPKSRLVIFDFGAHLVMAESAVSFNQTVLQFLDEND
jgi:pimeloyl-ACP methyl ester carboxylesterase